MMRCVSFFLLALLSVICTCHAYQFALISKTIPKGSYYVVTSLTSKYLQQYAANQRTQAFNSSISTTTTTDAYVDTVGTGYFAIVSMETDTVGDYCVIRVLDAESSTIQQSGLACTIAPSLVSARVQVEPSRVTCGGSNAIAVACKASIVAVLDIDAETEAEAEATQTAAAAATSSQETSGASLGAIIGATSAGIIGIFVIAGLLMYRAARNRQAAKNTTTLIFNNPSVTISPLSSTTSAPPGGVHMRSQTEQLMSTYMVNPVLDADQPDMCRPAPYQAGNIYKPRLNLANAAH